MSALLKSAKFLLILSLLFSSAGLVWAQSGSATTETDEEKETPAKADISDLGKVTLESLKAKPIYWLCRNRNIVRTLRIEAVEGGCHTIYTKDGLDRVVSQAVGVYSCVNIFGNIRRNLQAAGWTCKDISDSKVSDSP